MGRQKKSVPFRFQYLFFIISFFHHSNLFLYLLGAAASATFQLFLLIKFTITLTIESFSSALLSAINKVKATWALLARHRGIGSPDTKLDASFSIQFFWVVFWVISPNFSPNFLDHFSIGRLKMIENQLSQSGHRINIKYFYNYIT